MSTKHHSDAQAKAEYAEQEGTLVQSWTGDFHLRNSGQSHMDMIINLCGKVLHLFGI